MKIGEYMEGYLTPVGIVYEDGTTIKDGPILEMVKRLQVLLDNADYSGFLELIRSEVNNMELEDQLMVCETVLPGLIGVDISQVTADIVSGCYWCVQGQKLDIDGYMDDLPDWVKPYYVN